VEVYRWGHSEFCVSRRSFASLAGPADSVATVQLHDRMPVVLDKADIRRWLSGEGGAELLKPAAEDRLRMWPVSRRVNKTGTGDDDPTLLDEVAA
jgi:putative SOS response-associated peptidase YedK